VTHRNRQSDILRHFPTLLGRWRGGNARLWQLTTSHKALTIRVERPGIHGNLHVACIGPLHIRGPVDWSDSDIEIVPGPSDTFVVRDCRAGLEIHTEHVEVLENCKPVYTPYQPPATDQPEHT
jgi:hypothetical protein